MERSGRISKHEIKDEITSHVYQYHLIAASPHGFGIHHDRRVFGQRAEGIRPQGAGLFPDE